MRIGIDFGGTKIEAVALDEGGTMVVRERVPTPREDYAATVDTIATLVRQLERKLGVQATVGVGIPGAISPDTGLVKNANSTWCIGKPLGADIGRMLGREVRLTNDANCLAVSEAVDGAGAGEKVVFAAILGTGVGSGIAIDGKAIVGRHAIAGEWGHNPLPWPSDDERPGPRCYCGKHGCVETFCSGPGFAADYLQATGEDRSTRDIVNAVMSGEQAAIACWTRYCDRLARSLAGVVNVLDPDVIVLGGGMSNVDALYTQLPRLLPAHVFSDICTTPVRKAAHGDSSGVRGAAWLW
jgi:fructokinase